ncbi:MAG: ATP-binding protein, partial [Crocosphaera sp.]
MIEIFGDFTRELPSNLDSLEIIFSASSDVIKKRWKNNRLSAYFVADYFSSFFPIDEDLERIREMKGAVSYVANELLENAMRY